MLVLLRPLRSSGECGRCQPQSDRDRLHHQRGDVPGVEEDVDGVPRHVGRSSGHHFADVDLLEEPHPLRHRTDRTGQQVSQ